MTISIWRYSHLTLALVSGLFLVLACLTGMILAFEPIQQATKPYAPESLSQYSLAETLTVLQKEYDEVLSLEIDSNDFLKADVITKNGDSKLLYVHPKTGTILGEPAPQQPLFQFTTNLHRSLFLKGVGRFFVGLVSFLLCLIAVTGFLLLLKRQGGLRKLFSKVQKDHFELQYHVILSRWFLIPILIVAATGVYLSAEKFNLLPSTRITHQEVNPATDVITNVKPGSLAIFQEIKLDEVRSVAFPFSEFPEDYFEVALRDRELLVHQYTGEILSEQSYPFSFLLSRYSLSLHTGQGSILWSLVLLLTSGAVLFFIYSGFVMWRKRIKGAKQIKSTLDKDICTHVILVGSETGTTFTFAKVLEQALTQSGKKVLIAQMNEYARYEHATSLLFLTATYGEGEAPTNARNLMKLLKTVQQPRSLEYSVVGFGSLTYPSYCQFALDLNESLKSISGFQEICPLYKINNQSFAAFQDWAKQWSKATGIPLSLQEPTLKKKVGKKHAFEVVHRTELNADSTYLLQLKPKRTLTFKSGDLWEFVPKEDGIPRSYSVAKYQGGLLLSIKKHEFGICSSFLSGLTPAEKIEGSVKRNKDFHFPKHAPGVICIANGTGIAPFLGIMDENNAQIPLELYWGGRTKQSFSMYEPYVEAALKQQKLKKYHLAYSQESKNKQYVQALLQRDKQQLAAELGQGTVFMICGSMAMQNEVLAVLEKIALELLGKPLSDFEHQNQLKMDCY